MKRQILAMILLGISLLTSCMAPKKVVYVNDMVPNIAYRALEVPMPARSSARENSDNISMDTLDSRGKKKETSSSTEASLEDI